MFTDEFFQKLSQYSLFFGAVLVAASTFSLAHFTGKVNRVKEAANRARLDSLRNELTGGDAFAYITLYNSRNGMVDVMLRGQGGKPLFAINIEMYWSPLRDSLSAERSSSTGWSGVEPGITFPIIPETPANFHSIKIGQIKWRENGKYTILFRARNGFWQQDYMIWHKPGEPEKHQWEVTRNPGPSKIILIERTHIREPGGLYL